MTRFACRFFLLLAAAALPLSAFADVPKPPTLDAKSYALVDAQSGDILAADNPDARVEPASITKVMTVYIAFDEIRSGRIHEDDMVPISEAAWREGLDSSESRMFLKVGSQVRLIDLLRGIIIQSGNDASVAVAEYLGGSEPVFVDLMNQYAKKLGMTHTHFADASGMPNPDHYTTAYDLTILARALIKDFPQYYKIFSEREFLYNGIKQGNRNLLLERDPSVDGIKTGHTEAAGYCLLSSAVRDGRRLIAAVMGTGSIKYRADSSLALLNYGFRFFETDTLLGPNAPAATRPVYKGDARDVQVGTLEPVYLSLPTGSQDRVKIDQKFDGKAIAPFKAGQPLGEAEISVDGRLLKTVQLVALKDVGRGGLWRRIIDQIRLWFGW